MVRKGILQFLIFNLLCFGSIYISIKPEINAIVTEPIFFFAVFLLLIITCIYKKSLTISLTFFDFLLIIYSAYLIVSLLITPNFNPNEIFKIISLGLFFYGCKYIANLLDHNFFKLIFIGLFIFNLYFIIIFLYHFISIGNVNKISFFPNKSIFGILLATQISFNLPLLFKKKVFETVLSAKFYLPVLLSVFLSSIILVLLNGRASWIGIFAALLITIFLLKQNSRSKKIILSSLFVTLLIITAALFFYKKDSSLVRLFIYKTTLSIIESNWFTGIGPGQFQNVFNTYQAKYFSVHDINGNEAYLADNTNYVFNDYLQIFTEQGVIGFLFFTLLLYLTIKKIEITYANRKNDLLFLGSITSLSSIMVAAFFSYPLEIIPILIYVVLWLSVVNNFKQKQVFGFRAWPVKIFVLLIAIGLAVHSFFLLSYRLKSREAFSLIQAGHIQKAVEIHENLHSSYIKEGVTMYQYVELLKNTNQLEKAWKTVEKTKLYLANSKVYILAASIADEMGNYPETEKNYLMAIYIKPNRILPRYDLLNFYLKHGQKEKAIYWANAIQKMPIKVPSTTTSIIKNKVSVLLDTLKH